MRMPPFKMVQETEMEKYRYRTFYDKEPETLAWIDSFIGGTFLDIGANIGVYSLYCASRHRNMLVFAAEPMPENFARLRENIRLNSFRGIIATSIAFDESSGKKAFYIKDAQIGSSGSQVGFPVDEKGQFYKPVREIYVPTISVDEFAFFMNIIPNYIKIDVDGNEWRIIKGMKRYLHNINLRGVLVEINNDYDAIISVMREAGFTDDNHFNKMPNHSTARRKRENIKARNVIFTR